MYETKRKAGESCTTKCNRSRGREQGVPEGQSERGDARQRARRAHGAARPERERRPSTTSWRTSEGGDGEQVQAGAASAAAAAVAN